MTSPDFSKNTQSAIATPPAATRIDAPQTSTQRVDAKDGPQGNLPLGRSANGPLGRSANEHVEASRSTAPTETPKNAGPAPKTAHVGGSGLRQAVREELAASVACLSGERADAAGARAHLDTANRHLSGLSHAGETHDTPQVRPVDPAVPAVRVGGVEDVRDGQRAPR